MDVSDDREGDTEKRDVVFVTVTLAPPGDVDEAEVDEADEDVEHGEEDEEPVAEGCLWFLSIITAGVLALL